MHKQEFSFRLFKDKWGGAFMRILSWIGPVILVLIGLGLMWKSIPMLQHESMWQMLAGKEWKPGIGEFGFLPFVAGTFWVTITALILAFPLCLLTAIYFSEYASGWMKKIFVGAMDVLAGLPSVLFGLWGIVILVPFIRDDVGPFFGNNNSGYTILTASLVLLVMVAPLIIQVLLEVFNGVAKELREASWSLGATKWETIKLVVLKKAWRGCVAAFMLGFSRALGETLAVMMVIGNVVQVPHYLLQSGYTLPALIANNYGEMLSIPLYDSALMWAALLLLIIVLFFNLLSRWILYRFRNQSA